MDTELLSLFVDVYRAGGFAPVARTRGVDPSTVSRGIGMLEERLRVRLFQRTTRAMTPTDAATAFFHRVEPLVLELAAAQAELTAASAHPTGRLRVTASVSFGQIVLVPMLAAFHRACPQVQVDLLLSDSRLDLVTERIDLAVRHGPLEDSGMATRRLCPVSYHPVVAPDLLDGHAPIVQPADLGGLPHITFPYEGFHTAWRFRKGAETVELPVTPRLTVGNAVAIRDAVRAGLGVALLADWTVAEDLETGRLVRLLPDWQPVVGRDGAAVSLVFPERRFIPAKARLFADHLARAMARQPHILAAPGGGSPPPFPLPPAQGSPI